MAKLTREEVIEIVGELDDERIVEIIALGATAAELTEAFTRLLEDGYVGAELKRPLSGNVAALYEILKADEPPEREK